MLHDKMSRRGLFGRAAAAAGLGGLAGACAQSGPAGSNKLSQAEAGYQLQPHGFQRCGVCANYLPSGECKLVEGPISQNGWCSHYTQRAA